MKQLFTDLPRQRGRAILCLVLAALLVTSSLCLKGTLVARGEERTFDIGVNPESVTASLNEYGELNISGSGDIRDFTAQTAPFAGERVTRLRIGADVTAIGAYTFYDCGLSGVPLTLPAGLLRIGDRAFSGSAIGTAPRPSLVENAFTQALVTRRRAQSGEEDSGSPEESSAEESNPEESSTQESAVEESAAQESVTEESSTEESSDSQENPVSGDEEPDAAQSESPSQESEATEEEPLPEEPNAQASGEEGGEESRFVVETITSQEIGEEIFYPLQEGETPCRFLCSEENDSFRQAMTEAGALEADELVSAAFTCGDTGNSRTERILAEKLGSLEGGIVLPGLLPEFSPPAGSSFLGWTESKDAPDSLREAGSVYSIDPQRGETLFFIANWAQVPQEDGGEPENVEEPVGQESSSEEELSTQAPGPMKAPSAASTPAETPAAVSFSPGREDVQAASAAQTVTLPVLSGASRYEISASLSGNFRLSAPSGSLPDFSASGAGPENTYSLQLSPAAGDWDRNEGSAQVVLTGDSSEVTVTGSLPDTTGGSTAPELALTLLYDGSGRVYESGTVEVLLTEYLLSAQEGDDPVSVTRVTATISGRTLVFEQSSSVAPGRQFAASLGSAASIGQHGAISAVFDTWYLPDSEGAAQMKLWLRRDVGGSLTDVNFPAGSKLVLSDMNGGTYSYYFCSPASAVDGLALSNFSGWTAPAAGSYTEEKLGICVDFGPAGGLELTGDYVLLLTHGSGQTADSSDLAGAAFTVGQESSSLSITQQNAGSDSFTVTLSPSYLAADSRYRDGATVKLSLMHAGAVIRFPDNAVIRRDGSDLSPAADGSVSLDWSASDSDPVILLDLSDVPETMLASGNYTLHGALWPKAGLQAGSDGGTAQAQADYAFTLSRSTAAQRSISVSLSNDSLRLVDVSEGAVSLEFSAQYSGLQSGDRLSLEVMQKSGENYVSLSAGAPQNWTIPAAGAVSGSSGSFTVIVPQGQASGTYRLIASILDSQGNEVARQPYNFIVK